MNALVDLIKKIGIFMIAAQAVIHFAPGEKYEKYLKLIVGIMILLQLLSPIYSISMGAEADWDGQLSKIEKEMSESISEEMTGEISDLGIGTTTEKVIAELEEEIKSKLNSSISDENYIVTGVRVSMNISDTGEGNGNGAQQYTLEKIRVIVRMGADTGLKKTAVTDNVVKKVQIPKITVSGGSSEKENQDEDMSGREQNGEEQEMENKLREKFCNILGMGEEYMEVSIYGTVEEIDR